MRKQQNIDVPDCQHCEHFEECLPLGNNSDFQIPCKMIMSYDS